MKKNILLLKTFFLLSIFLSNSQAQLVPAFKGDTAGTVNGRAILRSDYTSAFDQVSKEMIKANSRPLNDNEVLEAHKKTWDQLVLSSAIIDTIEQKRITVSDDEIKNVLENNPPEFLTRGFIDSTGKLQKEEYLRALRDTQNSTTVYNVTKTLREDLKKQKLSNILLASIPIITDDELWQNYKIQKGATKKKFEMEKSKLREQSTTLRQQNFFSNWAATTIATAKIVDYRTFK